MKHSSGYFFGYAFKIMVCMALIVASNQCMDNRMTRDIIIDIDYTLTACCNQTEQNFIGTFTALSALSAFVGTGCSPVLISQANVGTTGYIITTSGTYQLSQNILFSPSGAANAITINASNVLLDLQCYSIEQGNLQAGVNGVDIAATFSNITIVNGSIVGMTGDGIQVTSGINPLLPNANITISDVQLIGNAQHGIFFNGSSLSPIVNISCNGLELILNGTGISSNFVNQGIIQNSSLLNHTEAGIELLNSYSHVIKYCTVADTQSSNSARGITMRLGGNNAVLNCLVDNTSTIATSSVNSAVGILIGSTENNDLILNNQISNSNSAGNARAYGLQMNYTFTALSSSTLPTIADGLTAVSTVTSIDWTPDGRYLATASGNGGVGTVAVYEYDGTSLMFVATTNQVNPMGLSWSPDGSFLAVGDAAATPVLTVYSFNGVSFGAGVLGTPALAAGNNVNKIDWSSDGRFIAAGLTTANQASVYEYSAGSNTLTLVASAAPGVAVNGVSWSPDVNYLAVGTTTQVIVYSFDGITLTSVAAFAHGAAVNSVHWSPDGRYVVMGGANGTGAVDTRVLNFTGAALVQVANFSHGATVQSVRWSQDGQYVLLGGATSGGIEVRGLQFQLTALAQVATFANTTQVDSVRWNPTGAVVAIGSVPVAVSGISVRVLTGLQFGFGSTIRNNLVTLNQGAPLTAGLPGVSRGIGLLASSAANLIIQNTAFANDLNYAFVTDVFRQYVSNTASSVPSLIANLSFPPL